MNSFALSIIFLIILLIYYYFPDFFDIETLAIIILISILVYMLPKSEPSKIIYGGNDEDIHSHNIVGGKEDVKYTKMSLMDPKHNLREIAKQLILLEDHMAHKSKRCIDCMTKHYLMIEGLLEEAISLDKTGEHIKEVRNITEQIQPAVMKIIDLVKNNKINDEEYQSTCQLLRKVRKEIAIKYVLNL
jgi:hypothetical protein